MDRELELAGELGALDALNRQLGLPATPAGGDDDAGPSRRATGGARKATGAPRPAHAELPEERIELTDPVLNGTAERAGWEESCHLSWRRGGVPPINLTVREPSV